MSICNKPLAEDEYCIYGISYHCPVLERREDCPLKEIDSLSFYEKLKWIEGLSLERKEWILKHRKDCSGNR